MLSATEVQRAYAQALLVDRDALDGYQDANDALMASQTLKAAFRTDVEPILAMARLKAGGAIDPIAAYRAERLSRQGRAAAPRGGRGRRRHRLNSVHSRRTPRRSSAVHLPIRR